MEPSQGNRVAELRTSARGWHGAQLAVLGFIGLCGVLQSQGDSPAPRWLQIIAGLLVLAALVLACVSTALVATVAWPVSRWQPEGESPADDAAEVVTGGRRLRLGIVLTFVAVAALALASTASWWPSKSESDARQLQITTNGQVVCGEPQQSGPGLVAVLSDGQSITMRLSDVQTIEVVDSCG